MWTRAGLTAQGVGRRRLTRLDGWSRESEGSERESEDGFEELHCVCSKSERRRDVDTVGRRWDMALLYTPFRRLSSRKQTVRQAIHPRMNG